MNRHNELPMRRWISTLLLGASLSAFAAAQDPQPQGFVGGDRTNLGDLLAPKGAGFCQRFGVRDVQGELRFYGKAGLDTAGSGDANYREMLDAERKSQGLAKFSAIGGLAADVRFLGALREVAALEARYEVGLTSATPESSGRERSNAVGSAADARQRQQAAAATAKGPGEFSKVMRVCGFTIRLEEQKGTRPAGWHQDGSSESSSKLGPRNLLPGGITAQVMVGPVPLLIRANAGVGVDFGMAPFLDLTPHATATGACFGLEGTAGAYLNGWVSAGIGAGCRFASVCAGLKADLRLMDTSGGVRVGYDTLAGLMAQLRYKLEPATLSLRAIAYCELWLGFVRVSKCFEHLLYQWSAPAIEGLIPAVGS